MKKLFLICLCFSVSLMGYSQRTDAESLAGNAALNNESYQDRARKYLDTYKLNDLGELEIITYLQVGSEKKEMYDNIINWIISNCTEAATAILYENEEEGRITVRCHFGKMANDGKKKPKEWVDIRPLLSVEIQDKEAIMKFILPGYEVNQKGEDSESGGFAGNNGFRFTGDETPKEVQFWPMANTCPYDNNSKFKKETCYIAYVHAIECYKILQHQVLNAGYNKVHKKKK